MEPVKKPWSRGKFVRVMAALLNFWTWHRLFSTLLSKLFPNWFPVLKMYSPAIDAQLIMLDGKTKKSLLHDYVNVSPNVPLILNIGSYN